MEASLCRRHWLSNMLFVNNFFPSGGGLNIETSCQIHTWYLAVDMQLFLLAVPLAIGQVLCHRFDAPA
eukprot:scaffold4289_cov242-Prasinococcus_capsulatus_cf.AAC.1